jgi:hypothetical protein
MFQSKRSSGGSHEYMYSSLLKCLSKMDPLFTIMTLRKYTVYKTGCKKIKIPRLWFVWSINSWKMAYNLRLLQSIISWTVVLSHHITRYSHLHISTASLKIVAVHLLLWSSWETTHLCEHYDQVTANAYAIMLVLHQDAWNPVLGNTRHVQVISRILWQVPWLIPAAAVLSAILEWLVRTNVATSWILKFSLD